MISRETASRIWNAYREVTVSEDLLSELLKLREKEDIPKGAPTLKDAFGRRKQFQMGIPSGDDCHRLFDVSPTLAESVIRAHIENKKSELVEANEQARIELENPTINIVG